MWRLALLLSAMVSLLVGGHLAVYWHFAGWLGIADPAARAALLAALLAAAVGFPAAAVGVHLRANRLTESLYVIAAAWMGLFLHLLLAIAVTRLGVAIAAGAGWAPRRELAALVGAAGAAAATAIGAWRALHPRLVAVEIALAGLPPAWHGRRVAQLSDLHLGFVHRRRFAERVVALINSAAPDLVVVTGDLFDGMGGDAPRLAAALDRLAAPRGVYFASGNHEVYGGIERARRALAATRVRVIDDEVADVDGLRLVGVAYPGLDRQRGPERLARLREGLAGGGASILLFHTPTNFDPMGDSLADQHFGTYWRPDVSCARERELGIGLQLSGHTHAGQIFPFDWLTRLIYRGRHYGLHRDGDFQLYVTSGAGTWGPPVRTGSRSEIPIFTLRPA